MLKSIAIEFICLLWTTFGPHHKRAFDCPPNRTKTWKKLFVTVGSNPLHRPEYKAIIQNHQFHLASFHTLVGYKRFIKRLGLHLRHETDKKNLSIYKLEEEFIEFLFCKRKDLPRGCKPLILLSNGYFVKGYWRRNKNTIEIFRPNPNSGKIYRPLPLKLHRKFVKYVRVM